jgi:hypothetical protein
MARPLRRSRVVMALLVAAFVLSLGWLTFGPGQGDSAAQSVQLPDAPGIGRAIEVQERHEAYLMAHPDVVGTAVGLTEDGRPAVKVYIKRSGVSGIPESLDGTAVIVEATGEFFALDPSKKGPPSDKGKGGGTSVSTTSVWPRPVPIGVSTGNRYECSAGTIGARVVKNGTVYALSNNHVYALENTAPANSEVLQPGRYDTSCTYSSDNVIGTLADFEPIVFSTSASNIIDAAIAVSSATNLGNATPSNGYGTPRSATVAAFVGQAVQKYGRTSQLTKGQVTGINATVNVGYSSGTARFVGQIIVGSKKPFIRAGDSGSLLVTEPNQNPVGLLYAGTQSGTAVANPIDPVLSRFGVTIDGE